MTEPAYVFQVYRRTAGGKTWLWYEDTEHGLAATVARVADLTKRLGPSARPVSRISIERWDNIVKQPKGKSWNTRKRRSPSFSTRTGSSWNATKAIDSASPAKTDAE